MSAAAGDETEMGAGQRFNQMSAASPQISCSRLVGKKPSFRPVLTFR